MNTSNMLRLVKGEPHIDFLTQSPRKRSPNTEFFLVPIFPYLELVRGEPHIDFLTQSPRKRSPNTEFFLVPIFPYLD